VSSLTAQDVIDAQESLNRDAVLNRYHTDLQFKYTVDAAVHVAIDNTMRPPSNSRITDFKLGAIFALALKEELDKYE
jgi:hypothetical protein